MNFKPFAYKYLTFNSPLSTDRATSLVRRCSPSYKILDLGCGWGELLLQTLAENPTATGVGVDNDPILIERAKRNAIDRNLQGRVEFICTDAKEITDSFDLVIASGTTHIWGGDIKALESLKKLLLPGGKLLYGCGVSMKSPTSSLKESFGELLTVEELQEIIKTSGLKIISNNLATIEEWDFFESSWRRGLEESGDDELIAFAAERKREYNEGYRGILGYSYTIATYHQPSS